MCFGTGAGGSLVISDADRYMTIAYVMNKMVIPQNLVVGPVAAARRAAVRPGQALSHPIQMASASATWMFYLGFNMFTKQVVFVARHLRVRKL